MKIKELLTEGTWSAPQTLHQAIKLYNLMSKPIRLTDAKDALYSLVGDDDLFDQLDDLLTPRKYEAPYNPDFDVRPIVSRKLKEWMDHVEEAGWTRKWDSGALEIIKKLANKRYGR